MTPKCPPEGGRYIAVSYLPAGYRGGVARNVTNPCRSPPESHIIRAHGIGRGTSAGSRWRVRHRRAGSARKRRMARRRSTACSTKSARRATRRCCICGARSKAWFAAWCASPKNPASAWSWKSAASDTRATRSLEFVAAAAARTAPRGSRAIFAAACARFSPTVFPMKPWIRCVTSADLHHSISGSYTRGLIHRGSEAFAVLGASPNEDARHDRRHPDVRPDLAAARERSRQALLGFTACGCSCRAASCDDHGAPPDRAGLSAGSRVI